MPSMKYELPIGVQMSFYGSLSRINRHNYYIVTLTSEILQKSSRAQRLELLSHV